ncbi:MAG: extensin family protein [Xanthomonadales bacterium]|nr:extensin family protein [Xanthomonadales bacterium]
MSWISEHNKNWLRIVALTVILGSFVYWVERDILPDEYNPLKPLEISDEITFLTSNKINNLKGKYQDCLAILKNSGVKFEPLPDKTTGESCGLYNTVHLLQSDITYGGGITLKCPALVSLLIWEKQALQPLAAEILQQPITRVKHFGTYACRNVNGAPKGRRSQHAFANAIDIAGFVLADGSQISVLKDWGKDNPSGKFLAAIHKSACDLFTTVLGPDYNEHHHNHFHFDHGSSGICE